MENPIKLVVADITDNRKIHFLKKFGPVLNAVLPYKEYLTLVQHGFKLDVVKMINEDGSISEYVEVKEVSKSEETFSKAEPSLEADVTDESNIDEDNSPTDELTFEMLMATLTNESINLFSIHEYETFTFKQLVEYVTKFDEVMNENANSEEITKLNSKKKVLEYIETVILA